MTMIKKTTASAALVALTSGLFVNGVSANSTSEVAAAEKLAAAGIVKQQSNAADYELNRNVLRQEIAAVARGLAKVEKTTTCTNMFRDVSSTRPNTWACYTVEALANKGLIAKNTNFRPESNITKAEAVGMIVKAAYGNEYNPVAGNGDWQKQVVDFAVSKGIVSQFSNYTTPATRGFVFEVAAKTLKDENQAPTDLENILKDLVNGTDTKTEPTKETTKETNVVRNDSNLVVTLAPENPSNGAVPANTSRSVMLAFNVTAGKEDVTLRKASLKFTGTGDAKIVTDLAIYSNDVKLTKNSNATFNSSRLTSDLNFDRDVVVKAGETKTLYVTATIRPELSTVANTYNQIVRVSLSNLESTATVTGADLTGATLTPYAVANIGAAEVTSSGTNGTLYLGQEGTIYNFSIKETNKREDLTVKALTFSKGTNNAVDLDNLTNLSLYAGDKKVNATFTIQKNKIVASLNETIKSNQKVNFVLKGEVSDDLGKDLVIVLDDAYIIGANTNVAVQLTNTASEITRTVQGTNVNFSFNRVGNGEVSVDVDEANVGELVFVTTSDYVADVRVTVSGNVANGANKTYENLELNGDGATATSTAHVFTFNDIDLRKGTTKLPLTVDTTEHATGSLTFKVEVIGLEDTKLGEDLSAAGVKKVLNNTQLTRTVTVKDSDLRLTSTTVNVTKVVAKDNQAVVLYKGRIDLSGSENVTLEDLSFTGTVTPTNSTTTNPLTSSLEDYVTGVTLNIGGKTFNGTVDGNRVLFDSIYAQIQANSKDVVFQVTATIKDRELEAGQLVNLVVNTDKVSYSTDKKSVANKTISTSRSTQVNIVSKENLTVTPVTVSNSDVVLAGSDNVALATFKIEGTSSDIRVDDLAIDAKIYDYNDALTARQLNSTIYNIRLMDGSTTIANGGYVVENTNTVKFDSFTLPQSGKTRTLTIVADVAAYSSAGGENDSLLGKVAFTNLVVNSQDLSTSNYLATETSKVTIVPAKVTLAATEKFNVNDAEAVVRVTVDAGRNDISNLELTSIELNNAQTFAKITVNGDDVTPADLTAINKEITNLNSFDVRMIMSGTESVNGVVILKKANFKATNNNGGNVTTIDFASSNKDSLSLGTYSTSN